MEHQLKEEITGNVELNITQENTKNVLGLNVNNIKKEKFETFLQSNTNTAFDGVGEQELGWQISKIKTEMQPSSPNAEEINDFKTCKKRFSDTDSSKTHAHQNPYNCSESPKQPKLKGNVILHHHIHVKTKLKNSGLKKRHECKFCSKGFEHKHMLMRHTRVHTGEKPFECDVCHRTFSLRFNMKNHMKVHKTDTLKEVHIESPVETKNIHECKVCSKTFGYNFLLTRHMSNHTGEKPYECSECNKKFSQLRNMKQHMKRHEIKRLKINSCEICHKSFGGMCAFKLHMNIHTREKLFKCSQCDKEFVWKESFKLHLLTHNKEKLKVTKSESNRPYKCEVCNKRFGQKFVLTRHMRTHTGEKPYECAVCHRTFSLRHNMDNHMKTHKRDPLKKIPQSNSGEIGMLSPGSMDEIKSEYKTIKSEKIDVTEIAKTEYTDNEKVKPVIDGKASSYLPYNSCFGEFICKEEVILPDEIEFD